VIVFYHLLVAVVGIVGLTGIWVGVQALARKQSPERYERDDVLACSTCDASCKCQCGMGHAMDEVEALIKELR
jgi:hypothetical protein